MDTLLLIIIATFLMSAVSLVGASVLIFRESILKRITMPLVAFAAGSLVGGAFLHLVPEAVEETGNITAVMLWVIAGFFAFLVFEQIIHWHHCHRAPDEHKHPVTYMILLSDGIHNFLDGLTIGAAFLANPGLGLVTTLAVAAHEIPQEFGDFGIMIHGGWSKSRALLLNFISGLTAVIGGIVAWAVAGGIDIIYLLPFAAGNFIYIAAADLIPEFKICGSTKRNLYYLAAFFLGLTLMYGFVFLEA